MPNLLLGLGKALGGLLDVLLAKHKFIPAVQSFSLVGVRGKRFRRQSREFISDIRLRVITGCPPYRVMWAA